MHKLFLMKPVFCQLYEDSGKYHVIPASIFSGNAESKLKISRNGLP